MQTFNALELTDVTRKTGTEKVRGTKVELWGSQRLSLGRYISFLLLLKQITTNLQN